MEPVSAFVLHHRPYRETSLLVEALTREHGRVHLVAKGVRKTRKRQSHSLQLFQPLWLTWYGRGELLSLSQAEQTGRAYRLLGSASLCGLYLNELLVRLLPLYEPEPELFQAYEQALNALQTDANQQVVLRLFEKTLLAQLGYGLQLEYEAQSQSKVEDEGIYRYHPENGPERVFSVSPQTISGRSLRLLAAEQGFDDLSLREIKQLMRMVLHYYLGGKPLHSRQLFAELNQFKTQK